MSRARETSLRRQGLGGKHKPFGLFVGAAVAEETGEPFPQKTIDLLQHIILSHHGVFEYGSPKLPAIPEAFFIHYLDNLDAKMYMTTSAIENDPDPNASFTSYVRALETRIYKHSDQLDRKAEKDEKPGKLFQ